jgi:hypothetical protein
MSTLLNRLAKTWGDAARDVVLIVASIMIAFALDAWWEDVGERRVQSEQIATLLSEFETARDTLNTLSVSIQSVSQATIELLTMMGPEAATPDSGKYFKLFGNSMNFGGDIPNQTALVSVLATGNPKIMESEVLIDLLGTWPSLMEDLEVDMAHLDRNRDIDLQAALVNIGIGGIAATPSAEKLGLSPSSFPIDTNRMIRSVEVYAALSYRALRLRVLSLNVDAALIKVELIIKELSRDPDKNSG